MTHQKFEGERTLMRIHIGESDKWHGKSLHEAIVEMLRKDGFSGATVLRGVGEAVFAQHFEDRKSTRLNSSHSQISYAVFCLKKKNGREVSTSQHTPGADR